MLTIEREYWDRGLCRLAGLDEAGRGPLAGPVAAAAVVFDPAWALAEEHGVLAGLTDSKQLTVRCREEFDAILRASPYVAIGVAMVEADEIDRINILRATHLAMRRAVENLPTPAEEVIVDGLPVAGLPAPSRAVVGGDALSLSIAAASVIAKVMRDARMRELDALYPFYGFARHKGYGTREHLQALYEHGPCPEHRRSFAPVKQAETNRAGCRGPGGHGG